MRLRFWLGKADALAMKLLTLFGSLCNYSIGPLPGVHYPDPGPGPDSGPTVQQA